MHKHWKAQNLKQDQQRHGHVITDMISHIQRI